MIKNEKITTHQKYPLSVKHGKPRLGKLKKGWQRVKIGDLVKEINRPVDMDDSKVYTLVKVKRSRGGVVKREDLQGKSISVKTQFYVREGDFLISKRQIVHGACGFVPKELDGAIVSNEYLILKCNNIIIPEFLNYLKDTIYFQQVCFHSSIGVHVEKMLFKVSQWYRWDIDIPDLEEQEKIASFLDAIALRITQLRRKHELLETYKKGVMQKIFSQQIRFKQDDGKPFTDWEKKKLKNICSLIKDGTHGTHKDDSNGQFFLLSAKNVFNGRVLYNNNDRKISQAEFLSIYKNYTLEKNDILLSIVGSIGRVAIFDGKNNLAFQRSVAFFRLKKDIPSFIYHQMTSFLFQRELLRRQVVSAQPGIYLGDLGQILVFIPCLEEQEKIANFLASIDKKIEAVALQIEKLEEFKKGLLQKMFV